MIGVNAYHLFIYNWKMFYSKSWSSIILSSNKLGFNFVTGSADVNYHGFWSVEENLFKS